MGTVRQEKLLERIADSLESISSSLSNMQLLEESLCELAECITDSKKGKQFCITGEVTRFEP